MEVHILNKDSDLEKLIKHNESDHVATEDMSVAKQQECMMGTLECGDICRFSESLNSEEATRTRSGSVRKLIIATVLCLIFIAVEVTGGIFANSLAILTDAAHLLSDVASFAISLFAIWASSWEATPKQTYGFFRLEILGALVSIQLIWLLTGILVYEAFDRLMHAAKPVDGRLMFIIASFGLCINIAMMLLLGHHHGHSHSESTIHHNHDHDETHHHEHEHTHPHEHEHSHHCHRNKEVVITCENTKNACSGQDHIHALAIGGHPDKCNVSHYNINLHGAYLHALGDLVQSIGVMIAGAIIWAQPSWKVVDLICTLLFSVVVLTSTMKMLREIVEVLMESTPSEIDCTKLENGLRDIPGVISIHELHIWAITRGKPSLACHVAIKQDVDADAILSKVLEFCKKSFHISHATIQIERFRSRSTPL